MRSIFDDLGVLHDEVDAGDDDGETSHDVQGNGNSRNLDVQEDQTTPRALAESSPGVGHGSIATSTNNGRLETTLEGAIKGDDGLVIGRDEGRLDASEDHVGGDNDEDGADNGDDEDDEALGEEGRLLLGKVGNLAALAKLGEIQSDGHGQESGEPAGNLGGEPDECDGLPDSVKGALEGGQTAPEVQSRSRGDGDVDPSGAELDEGEGREEGSDGDEEVAEG